jgi:hypothetical protein
LRIGCNSTLEYSHLIREFKQFDSAVVYGYFGNSGTSLDPTDNTPSSTAGFAIVPNGETQIDRLKFASKIGCDTDMYVLGYLGYNRNQLRNTSRDFNGADLRITNSSLDNLTLTGYGKYYREETSDPTVALNTAYPAQAKFYREANLNGLAEQVNREVHAVGVDGRWRPFQDECGTFRSRMAIVGGYEYSTLMREHAEYEMAAQGSGPFVVSRGTAGSTFHQPNSNRNAFVVGVEENWSCAFTTYLRYKYIATEYPLYAVTHEAATSIDASLGSNLPTQENRVEVGATWTPTDNLMVNATLYLENAMSDAPYVNWTSNTLPFVVSAWYAPTECWSITGGAAVMEGWINQEVTLAQLRLAQPVQTAAAVDLPWQYTSSSDVFNVGTRYMATEKLAFSGDFEYVRGLNSSYAVVNPALSTPVVPGAPGNGPAPPYEIGQYSLVRMESYRLGAGVDYLWRPRVTTFLRYNYYDYRDLSLGVTSGQAHMFLGGMSALF